MRAVLGIIFGFLVATAATTALSFAGRPDPALIGAAHIAIWLVVGLVIARSGRDRSSERAAPSPVVELADKASDPSDGPSGPPDVGESELATTDDGFIPPDDHASVMPTKRPARRPNVWLVGLALFGAIALVASLGILSGFLGARMAMEGTPFGTTTASVPEEDPTTWPELTDAEKVYCTEALFPASVFEGVPPLEMAFSVIAESDPVWLERRLDHLPDLVMDRHKERTLVAACRALYDSRFPRPSTP